MIYRLKKYFSLLIPVTTTAVMKIVIPKLGICGGKVNKIFNSFAGFILLGCFRNRVLLSQNNILLRLHQRHNFHYEQTFCV